MSISDVRNEKSEGTTVPEIEIWGVYTRTGKNKDELTEIFSTEEAALQYIKITSENHRFCRLHMGDDPSDDFQGVVWCAHEAWPYDRHHDYYGAYFSKENAIKDLRYEGLVPDKNDDSIYIPEGDTEFGDSDDEFDFEYIQLEKYTLNSSLFVKCANKK